MDDPGDISDALGRFFEPLVPTLVTMLVGNVLSLKGFERFLRAAFNWTDWLLEPRHT